MTDEHVCPICERSFGSSDALLSHRRAKRHYGTSSSPPWWRQHAGKVALGAGGLAVLGWLTLADDGPRYPTTDSHWHAGYVIEVCGRELAPRPYSQGDVHTHGDGKIHIHPTTHGRAGRAANLGAFFRSIGGTVQDSLLNVRREGTWRTGEDSCGDRPGRVAVYVDGERIEDPAAYVPMDGQDVRIAFEPAPDPGTGASRELPDDRLAIPLPDVRVATLPGEAAGLREHPDEVTVVNFWATWCLPCLEEIPHLVALEDSISGERGRVLGIAIDSGSPEDVRAFARKHDMDYDLAMADRGWARDHFDVFGLPVTLVVGRDDTIRHRLLGPHDVGQFLAAARPYLERPGKEGTERPGKDGTAPATEGS